MVGKSKDLTLKMENSIGYNNGSVAQHLDRNTLLKTGVQPFPKSEISVSKNFQQYYELEQTYDIKNSV